MPQPKRKVVRRPAQKVPVGEVEINDNTIRMMLHDSRFLNNFPFLRHAKQQAATRRKCGGCGGARMKVTGPNIATIRRNLANMPAVKKLKLKALLGAKQVKIRYMKPVGGAIVKRF